MNNLLSFLLSRLPTLRSSPVRGEPEQQPPRSWRPPERSGSLKLLDGLILLVLAGIGILAFSFGWLIISGEMEDFMWLDAMIVFAFCGLALTRLIPKFEEIPFDHFAVIERWAQPHRMRGMGYVMYFPGLGERIFAVKRMRSEATVLSFAAHTLDGVKVSGTFRFWLKPIEGTDPFAAAYRLAKTGGKVDQFGKKIIEDLVGRCTVPALMQDRIGFCGLVRESMDVELRSYLHRVRDLSLGSIEVPPKVAGALEETFIANQRLSTADVEAKTKMILTAAEPSALLPLFMQFLTEASDEQRLRVLEMVMNHKIVQAGGNHISMSMPHSATGDGQNALLTALLATGRLGKSKV